MRWFILILAPALALGCAKRQAASGPTKPEPSDAAFAADSPENTLSWLAAQRGALQQSGDLEAAEKFKAVAESMKGRQIDWPRKLAQAEPDGTGTLLASTLDAEPPGPRGEERREWQYVMVCRPFDPAARLADDAPLVRRPEVGFPLAPGDWSRAAKAGAPVRLTGTVAAVQLHRRSWVTGYGIQDRVVHTEIGITLHLADGTVSPAK
jgi:hypothetical protein